MHIFIIGKQRSGGDIFVIIVWVERSSATSLVRAPGGVCSGDERRPRTGTTPSVADGESMRLAEKSDVAMAEEDVGGGGGGVDEKPR